jgi:two-component system cell cycle sensor histidine kinase/response regulator CckA
MRLRTKTSLLLVTIVAVLLGLAAAVSLKVLQASLKESISSGLASLSQNTARYIAAFLEDGLRDTRAIAAFLSRDALTNRDPAAMEKQLETMAQLHPNLDNGLFVLDADGNLWADYPHHLAKRGMSYASRDYFLSIVKDGQATVSSPHLSDRTLEPVLTFAAPLTDETGRLLGVLGGSARLLGPNALGELRRQAVGKSGYIYVFDRSRMIVLHPDADRMLQRDVPAGVNKVFDKATMGFEGVGETESSHGLSVLIAVHRVPGSDWIVAAQQPIAEAFAPLEEARYRLILNTLAGALAALLLGLFAVRHLTAPLLTLQKMALHLSARFTEKPLQPLADDGQYVLQWENFRGDEEVTDLHRALRKFSEALTGSLVTLRDLVKSWEETFDAVPDMVFIIDRDYRIVRCNQAATQLLSVPMPEILGQSCYKIMHDGEWPHEFCPNRETLTTKQTSHREIKVPKLGRVFDISTTPLLDEKGKVAGSVHVARDITGRKRTEEALRESEQRYHTLFDSALDAILLTDEQGKVIDCNAAAEGLFQIPIEGLMGTALLECAGVCEPEKPAFASTQQELLRLVQSGVPQRFEWNFQATRGHVIAAEVSLSRIVIGGRTGMLAMIRDISKQKEVQRLIEQERQRLSAMLDGSPVATVMINPYREVLLWNRASEALTLTPKDEALGRTLDLSHLLKDKNVPVLAELLLDQTEDEILKRYGQRGIRRYDPHSEAIEAKGSILVGGKIKRVHVIASRIRDPEGQLLGIIQCAQDITKEERLQKQLLQAQKMESVGTLAGGMAHEFNNILAAMQGYTQLAIMEAHAQEPLTSYLDVVEASCQRAANLVRNMLTFARADEGRKIPVKVNQLVENTQQLLRQTLPPDVVMELDLEPGLPFILADPNQIEQALINLAVNAKDAMPRGGKIRLQSRLLTAPPACLPAPSATRQAAPFVEVCVADAGEGIPGDIRDRIFDPFFTTKAPGKGTGLGLSIVYSIMDNHHGCVLVDSEPGRGTQFRLYFPAMEEVTFVPAETPGPGGISRGQGEAILVVDDEDRLREMLAEILEGHGYRVELAANGRDGLMLYEAALARGNPYDLVILDLAMPVMGGQECLKGLFELAPRAKVLVMSGLMEDVEKDEVLKRVRGFLRKPFLLSALLSEVRNTLGAE